MNEQPYGANEQMNKWRKDHGYRYVPRAHCLHWISKGRCGVGWCEDGHSSRSWMDHISGWLEPDGKRLLLCQPYAFSDARTLVDACTKFDLTATITGAGWYGHGTVAIELRAKGQDESCIVT
jgi:hypothetical protein